MCDNTARFTVIDAGDPEEGFFGRYCATCVGPIMSELNYDWDSDEGPHCYIVHKLNDAAGGPHCYIVHKLNDAAGFRCENTFVLTTCIPHEVAVSDMPDAIAVARNLVSMMHRFTATYGGDNGTSAIATYIADLRQYPNDCPAAEHAKYLTAAAFRTMDSF